MFLSIDPLHVFDFIVSFVVSVFFDSFMSFDACFSCFKHINLFLKHLEIMFYLIQLNRRNQLLFRVCHFHASNLKLRKESSLSISLIDCSALRALSCLSFNLSSSIKLLKFLQNFLEVWITIFFSYLTLQKAFPNTGSLCLVHLELLLLRRLK